MSEAADRSPEDAKTAADTASAGPSHSVADADSGPAESKEAAIKSAPGPADEEAAINPPADLASSFAIPGEPSTSGTPGRGGRPHVKGNRREWVGGSKGKGKDEASGSSATGAGKRQRKDHWEHKKGKKAKGEGGEGRGGGKGREEGEVGAGGEGDAGAEDNMEGEGGEGDGEGEGKKRLPKRRVALLLGYCGTGYSGMQIQKQDTKTIEGDVFAALVKAGAISEDNSSDHRKVDVQRSARTDAGVHAAGNVISLKMIVDPPLPEGVASLTDYVNSFLPDQIRMWGFVRALKSFQARLACDSRVYEYLLPSYCLLPPASSDPICKRLNESSPGWRDILGPAAVFADETPALPELGPDEVLDPRERGEFERRRGWRVDSGTLERFRALVAEYKGTHNYHNYTVGKPFNDRTVKRFMIQLEVRDPIVHGEIEWISVRIHGQSFMLHQIRKMLSLAMLACRTASPPSLIPETFGPKRIHIPKAPPLGLLLQAPQFRTYNERLRTQPPNPHSTEPREPVDFSLHEEKMDAFKRTWIYERLRQDELEGNVFHKWMRQVDCSSSAAFSFLNTSGTIPAEASVMQNRKDPASTAASGGAGEGTAAKGAGAGVDEDSDDEELDTEALRKGELEG